METVEFEQVIGRGCGIDVHKKTVVATINGEGLKRSTREFGTVTSSLTELKDWLLENGITHVAMESTGVYWKPVYHVLEPSGIKVWIVNARHVKNVPGHKTDKKDSAWLCKLLLAGLLKPSYIPPKEPRELRDRTRYRKKLVQDIASNKNRIIRILEDCNVKLSSVLSDTSGVNPNVWIIACLSFKFLPLFRQLLFKGKLNLFSILFFHPFTGRQLILKVYNIPARGETIFQTIGKN